VRRVSQAKNNRNTMLIFNGKYNNLLNQIGHVLTEGRQRSAVAVIDILIQTYWQIGKEICEYEQHRNQQANLGTPLFEKLAKDLSEKHGKTFSRTNLFYIRKLFLKYPDSKLLSHKLSWSHYFELLKVEDDLERSFYEKQTVLESWSVRELKRQKKSSLFHRLALSRDKEGILKLAKEGQIVEKPEDFLREPYTLEFLNIPEQTKYRESDLEQRIIDNLQTFLLELGKGFAFIGRQYRIMLNNHPHRVDLVFYHIYLKCYILIDLKRDEAEYGDVGQMNVYLNYFKQEVNRTDDNEPVGIILAANNDDVSLEYALGGLTNQIFISKYQLYLPDKAVLEERVRRILEENSEEPDSY
jgi:predicted nuclease of restriction endonuclease-like (RecB) superfamily